MLDLFYPPKPPEPKNARKIIRFNEAHCQKLELTEEEKQQRWRDMRKQWHRALWSGNPRPRDGEV